MELEYPFAFPIPFKRKRVAPMTTFNLLLASEFDETHHWLAQYLRAQQAPVHVIRATNWDALFEQNSGQPIHFLLSDSVSTALPFQGVFEYAQSVHFSGTFCLLLDGSEGSVMASALGLGITTFVQKSHLMPLVHLLQNAQLNQSRDPRPLYSAEILESFLKESSDAIWVKNTAGRYLLINPAGARFLGRPVHEILGKTDRDVFPPEAAERICQSDQKVLETGETHTVEDKLSTLDGQKRAFLAVKGVFKDQFGKPQGILGTVRDITARVHAEETLQYYAARLEQSNKDLEQFAMIASHDLQAPLRKIQVFSEMLMTQDGEEAEDTRQRIQTTIFKMQQLITDLLSLSQVHRKGRTFQTVSLDNVVENVLVTLETAIQEQNATVNVGYLGMVQGDPVQLEQLFQNLLTNSLKFKKQNEACLIRIKGEALLNGFCQISFQDNGIGFSEKDCKAIFQPFQRLHSANVYPGTGIGLSICQRIVERHGGQLTATSQEGQGATFFVYLPVHQGQSQQQDNQISSLQPPAWQSSMLSQAPSQAFNTKVNQPSLE